MMKSRPFSKSTGNPTRDLRPNIRRQKLHNLSESIRKPARQVILAAGFCLLASVFALTGCGPKYTFSAATVPQSIEKITSDEYHISVKARVVGRTVGAVYDIDNLLDDKGQINKDVHDKMGKIMQEVSRVALSTDLPVDFCVVVIRDVPHGSAFTITRSVDDTRRAEADAIGVEESINRTVFGQEKVAPNTDRTHFVLKEVKLPDFLTDQIVQRIRFNFSKDSTKDGAAGQNAFALVDGAFDRSKGRRALRFSVIGLKASEDPHSTILGVFKVVNDVLAGYHFTDFDVIEIQDYLNRLKLVIDKKTLLDYQQKKINTQQILAQFLTESQSIQEAFKLFGFNIPQE